MKLYYSPGACSLSPHIVLRELNQKFDLKKVDLGTKKTDDGKDFTKVNPKGYVPALELDNGEVLTEGPMILQYLADQAKASQMLPSSGMPRYRVLEWLNFITSELHKGIGGLFNKSLQGEGRDSIVEKVGKRLEFLNNHFAKNKFLMGENFSVADAYAFTCIGWCKYLGIDIAKWPNLSAYMERIATRPAVKDALAAEAA